MIENKSFVRNHYYYGKLLSVDDFELEQKYFKEKIEHLSQLSLKKGVIKGLTLTLYDEALDTLILSKGIAVDALGRFIVVPEDKKINLNHLDDLEMKVEKGILFFILRYHELHEKDSDHIYESYEVSFESAYDAGDIVLAKIKIIEIGGEYEILEVHKITQEDSSFKGVVQLELHDDKIIKSENIYCGQGQHHISLQLEVIKEKEHYLYGGSSRLLNEMICDGIEVGYLLNTEEGYFNVLVKSNGSCQKKIKVHWQLL